MNAVSKLTKARIQLVLDAPFFGSLALRLRVVADTAADTAYTDGVVLGFAPGFVDALSLEATRGLIAHEVMHLACLHHTRRGNRDRARWNVAADFAINQLLLEAGFTLPEGALIDERFAGKSAEAIYDLLPAEPSEAGGVSPGQWGEIRDAPEPEPGDGSVKQTEATWRVNIAQAAQQARAAGNLPAGIARLVEKIVSPQVDWREVLRVFFERVTRNDYAWLPPSRRYLTRGLYLPSLYSNDPGSVVVAVDTSDSVEVDDLACFAAEVSSVLESYDMVIDLIYCDTQIQGHKRLTRDDLPLTLTPVGGGGTDFRPVFEWAGGRDTPPCCLVYLTDLECHRFPDKVPDYPVLWVRSGDGGVKVPFGEVIDITR
jgi:predicted metal-dependent peptidase